MKLTREYRWAAIPGRGQESYLKRKLESLMVEVETMHSSAGNLYNGLKALLGIMQDLKTKYGKNLGVSTGKQHLPQVLSQVEQIYMERLGPAVQELYDLFYDELFQPGDNKGESI